MSIREVGARLVLDIKDAEAKIKQIDREIKQIEKAKIQFDINNAKLEQLRQRLEEIKKEKEAIQNRKLELQADLTSLNNFRNQLKNIDKEISNLKSQLYDLSNKKIAIDIQLKTNANEIAKVKSDGSLSSEEKGSALESLYAERSKLQSAMREIGIEVDKIQQKINNLNKTKIKIQTDISELKDSEKEAKGLDSSLDKLDKEEHKINVETSQLEEANKGLDKTISKGQELNNTKAQIQSGVLDYEATISKLNNLQKVANGLKSASKITFKVGSSMSNLGSSMINIAKNFQNNPLGDIGRFLVQGVGYSTLYRLTSNAENSLMDSVGKGIERYDTINVAKRTLSTIMSDVENADSKIQAMIANLDSSIEGLPTTLSDALSHVTKFTSINHDLDRSQKLFSAINDAILTFGGSSEQVNNAVTQYSQIMGSKMDARTLRSMEDAGMTPVLTAIAKQMGMSFAEFRNNFTGQDPTISLEQFENALIELDEKGGGGLDSLASMAKVSVSTITNAFNLLSVRLGKAFQNITGAFDEVVKNITGKSIYENVYGWSEQILKWGDNISEFIKGHQKEIGEGLDFLKGKLSDLWNVLKTFDFKEFVNGFKQGFEDFEGPLGIAKDFVEFFYGKFKDLIYMLGDGNFSKGLGRFISDWFLLGSTFKVVGTALKVGSGGLDILSKAVSLMGSFTGKDIKIPFLSKLGSKASSFKNIFKSADAVSEGANATKTFDAVGFKNKLSSLALIAGGAGTIILYCKAIKEIEKNIPNDVTTLPLRLINLFSVMGAMSGLGALDSGLSELLGYENVLTGLALMLGQGGALWLFAKAMQELDKTMPDGSGAFDEKLTGLVKSIALMAGITGAQGGLGIATGGISTLAQVLGIFTTSGLAMNLIQCAKAMSEIDKNVPSNTGKVEKKVKGIMNVLKLFEGEGTLGSWWGQVIKSSEALWKNMETWSVVRILKKLASLGESISSIQEMSIDSSSFKDQFKDIQEVVKDINDFKFPTVSTSSATNISDANNIVKNYTTMASSLSRMSNINGSSINKENCATILKSVADVVDSMKRITFPDITKSIKSNLNATNAQSLLDTLKILEQIIPEFTALQTVFANNPLPKGEDIGNTITKLSQAIGYISNAGVDSGTNGNMLSYNLRQLPDVKLFKNALQAVKKLGEIILAFGTINTYSNGFDFETLRANVKTLGNSINDIATNKGLTSNLDNMDTVKKTVNKLNTTCETLNSIIGLNLDFVKVEEVVTGIKSFLNSVKGVKVGEATTDVVKEVNSIVTSFKNMASNLAGMKSDFNTSGVEMASGITEGFNSVDVSGSFGTKINDAKSNLKKKSFKSVGKKFGSDVVSGFSEGLSNMSSSISNQITLMYGYSTRFTDLGQYLGSSFKNAFNNQSGKIDTSASNQKNSNYANESSGNISKFAKGGPVYLRKGGTPIVVKPQGTDTVPAMLTPGEYVIKKDAVNGVGTRFLDRVNKMDLKGAFRELTTHYGSQVGSVVNKTVTINNVTNNDNRSIAFTESNERRQYLKANRYMRGLA